MRLPRRRSSLGVRYVGAIVLAQIVFGSALGVVVGLYSVQAVAREREEGLKSISQTIAASLLPVIADQDPERISAQLDSILRSTEGRGIVCIRIRDGAGHVVADSSPGCTCDEVAAGEGPFSAFLSPRIVEQAVTVDGLEVARAQIQFEPIGLREALLRPLAITALVVMAAVVVSGLWGTWILLHTVVEPVGELRDAAIRIAEGERDVSLSTGHSDEIGELADALERMTRQLGDRERRLLESYVTLEDAYREQERMRQQVQRLASVKSDFVAVASHELRSPLAVLTLYGEMLQEGQYGELPAESRDAVEAMLRATARLSSIVASLMDVAMLERGMLPLDLKPIRVDEIVDQAVEDAAVLGRRSEVVVRTGRTPGELNVRGDPLRLRQVLDNLLSNAVKYSEVGGEVIVSTASRDDRVEIRVADRGRGVPPDRVDDLFEPFGRLDADDDSAPGGAGLGLAVSAKIVRAHGGTIVVESNTGKGSVFVVTLPVTGPSSERTPDSVKVV